MLVTSIGVDSIAFLTLAGAVVLTAWSRWRRHFRTVLLGASLVMVASWLGPWEVAALGLFVFPPYFLIRRRWARPEGGRGWLVPAFLVWQVLLFILLRGYGPADLGQLLGHPLTITGMSYILFRQIHMLIDAPTVEHRQPLTLQLYLVYLLAFWTFLAGPIQRYEDFINGLNDVRMPEARTGLAALHRIANGLIFAFLIAPLFLETQDLGLLTSGQATWADFLVVFYSFPVYLYLNFMGYTEVMIGLSRLCGMTTMPENFRQPYLARNIQDFWSRWHISLTVWIGHYVFNPIMATVMRRTEARWHAPLMVGAVYVTFFIVGMWHGTTVNYLIFGMWHATGIMITVGYDRLLNRTIGKKRKKEFLKHPLVHWSAVFVCLHFIFTSMLAVNYPLGELWYALSVFFS